MKYWIFQNNQVLGPYEPEEMGKISVFSPESLVCPEGRRGTSMGDWQRAGMVPDLSVALVRASASGGGKTALLSIAGMPPEPTLKDLAQLGSIQEKVALLEDVVIQLQEGLRAKDAELSSVHQELVGKSREASEIKIEAATRQREAEELKRQIAGLEERLASVRILSETLDKAVEEEKRVESDVEKQGKALTDLANELEELRRQLKEAPPQPAPAFVPPPPVERPQSALPADPIPVPSDPVAPIDFPTNAPAATPAFDTSMPTFDASMPSGPTETMPPAAAPEFEAFSAEDPSAGQLAPEPAVEAPGDGAAAPAPAAPKGKKALLLGAVLGLAGLSGLAFMGGYVPGLGKPKAPAPVLDPMPLPPPEPAPAPAPAPDYRQLAVDFAKSWVLRDNRTLEAALEKLAPPTGNLSPWMADPLIGGRVQVNYFAHSSAPGAPTIAYEFEVDLDGHTLVGRNAAAKSVLSGKAATPPKPPKPKPVRVKPKVVQRAAPEDSLDTLLDPSDGDSSMDASIDTPAPQEKPRPAPAARRAAKTRSQTPPADAPPDETLLDDLLKE